MMMDPVSRVVGARTVAIEQHGFPLYIFYLAAVKHKSSAPPSATATDCPQPEWISSAPCKFHLRFHWV